MDVQLKVSLTFQQLLEAVKQLPQTEKELINEALWDEDYTVPLEHQELVLERKKQAEQNPETLINWDEAQKMMNA